MIDIPHGVAVTRGHLMAFRPNTEVVVGAWHSLCLMAYEP